MITICAKEYGLDRKITRGNISEYSYINGWTSEPTNVTFCKCCKFRKK